MYAERIAHRPTTLSRAASTSSEAARSALYTRLGELAEMLSTTSPEDPGAIRERVQEAQRGMREAGVDDGLLALLLRNMVVDLAKDPKRFDSDYFAAQLSRAVERRR